MSSRDDGGNLAPVARRIRFLRGSETQEAFAKRAGISRSALANYETGRSQPSDYVLATIAKNTGTSADYFASNHDPLASGGFSAVVGAVIKGLPDWTDDEAAFVRMLRLCDYDTIRAAIGIVLDGVNAREVTVPFSTILTITDDVQRLMNVRTGDRKYGKGSLATFPEDSPKHRLGFKSPLKAFRKGPQSGPQSDSDSTKSKP